MAPLPDCGLWSVVKFVVSKLRILQCLACLLMLVGMGQVHAQFVIDETASGAWYDPSHDGEGFLLGSILKISLTRGSFFSCSACRLV